MDSSMDLKSMTLEELTDCVMELGEKKFRAKQIYGWLHQKLVRSPEEMKNVPAKCIEKLLKEHPFYGVEEVEQIEHKMLSSAIEKAQKKIESNNFGIRKNLLEYDQVMNEQREIIYAQRKEVLTGENLKE